MAEYNITGAKLASKPMVFELDINEPPQPIILLVNPETLDIKSTSKVTESRTRWTDRSDSAYVLQAHHDELDVLSASGKSAMFYSNKGITIDERTKSLGWENIQQLVAIYRNNGMNFSKKPGKQGSSVIQSIGRVVIAYDGYIYRGAFESFSLTEVQEKPFNLDFSFDFKVSRTITARQLSQSILQNYLANDSRV